MAIRNIRTKKDEILKKRSKEVGSINDRIHIFLDDMAETMYKLDGIGLAAPQVGILKRIFIIDVGEGIIEFINPRIISQKGEQKEFEGCLSVPRISGEVNRPACIKVEALNRKGETFIIEGEGLLARALSHEYDHLNGILFTDKAIRLIREDEEK